MLSRVSISRHETANWCFCMKYIYIMQVVLTSLFIILCSWAQAQTVLYHEYTSTASDWDIVQWNTPDTNSEWRLREHVDIAGRVIMLEFLHNDSLNDRTLCYLASKVVYNYTDTSIIELLFQNNLPIVNNECDLYHKTIYHIDRDNYIKYVEIFALYDTTVLSPKEVVYMQQYIPPHSIYYPDSSQMTVDYYYYSYAKMNGIYPVSKNYKVVPDSDHSNEPEQTSINKGIDKLRAKE